MSRLAKHIGHLETVTVTYPTPVETYNVSGVMLPAAEPASGQFSYTIQSSDLAVFSDSQVSCKWTAMVVVGGKNNIAASKTLGYRILKNGVSVETSTLGVYNSYYWSLTLYDLYDVKVGDVLEVRLWCTNDATSLDWRYNTYWVRPTRFVFGSQKDVFFDFQCTEVSEIVLTSGPAPTGYAAGESGSVSIYYYPSDSVFSYGSMLMNSSEKLNAVMHSPTYGLGQVLYGDNSKGANKVTSGTFMPYYNRTNRHTKFRFRRARL